jgi:hypothetical protein
VRFLVVASCIAVVTTGPALACPRAMMCLVTPERTAPEVAHAAKRPPQIPNVRKLNLRVKPRARLTFTAPAKPDPNEIEMPWIWRVLREQVYSQMPSHRSRGFALTLSPVVVTTPSETVPGLGVGGEF